MHSVLDHWYFHVPNFVLATLFYTLLGRILLGIVVDHDSPNYIWRFFCRLTDPVVNAVALITPQAVAPVVVWFFALAWLLGLRIALYFGFAAGGLMPAAG